MNNSNRKKRRNRAQVAHAREEARAQESGMSDHRGGTFRVFNRETKEQKRGLNWQQAVDLWREWDNTIILEDN